MVALAATSNGDAMARGDEDARHEDGGCTACVADDDYVWRAGCSHGHETQDALDVLEERC